MQININLSCLCQYGAAIKNRWRQHGFKCIFQPDIAWLSNGQLFFWIIEIIQKIHFITNKKTYFAYDIEKTIVLRFLLISCHKVGNHDIHIPMKKTSRFQSPDIIWLTRRPLKIIVKPPLFRNILSGREYFARNYVWKRKFEKPDSSDGKYTRCAWKLPSQTAQLWPRKKVVCFEVKLYYGYKIVFALTFWRSLLSITVYNSVRLSLKL